MTTPDWLTQRGGSLKRGSDGGRWYVLFAGQPNYSLAAVPAQGKFICVIRQTINGFRIEKPATFATEDEAIQGGLNGIREAMGW
jgi:hypothetical protein